MNFHHSGRILDQRLPSSNCCTWAVYLMLRRLFARPQWICDSKHWRLCHHLLRFPLLASKLAENVPFGTITAWLTRNKLPPTQQSERDAQRLEQSRPGRIANTRMWPTSNMKKNCDLSAITASLVCASREVTKATISEGPFSNARRPLGVSTAYSRIEELASIVLLESQLPISYFSSIRCWLIPAE